MAEWGVYNSYRGGTRGGSPTKLGKAYSSIEYKDTTIFSIRMLGGRNGNMGCSKSKKKCPEVFCSQCYENKGGYTGVEIKLKFGLEEWEIGRD